ncbi:MAG: hypothetical protein AABW63_02895 [Nanoarchaeota archaeon]
MVEKTYFNRALVSLGVKYPELRKELRKVKDSKKKASKLFRWVLLGDVKKEIREYHFFLYGILVKTLALLESLLIELDKPNPYLSNMVLRAHYENLAAIHYFARHPEKRMNLTFGERYSEKGKAQIEAVHVNDMIKELHKNTPPGWDVLKDIDNMSNIIHPNKRSHQLNITSKTESILEFSSYCVMSEEQVKDHLKANNTLVTSILNGISDIDNMFIRDLKITKQISLLKK